MQQRRMGIRLTVWICATIAVLLYIAIIAKGVLG
jgi:hypothetical protein